MRAALALAKGEGGELEDAASLFGLGYIFFVFLFLIISALSLWLLFRMNIYRLSAKSIMNFIGIFVSFFILIVILETIDVSVFQHRFPHIEIDDGRVYHDPDRNYQ